MTEWIKASDAPGNGITQQKESLLMELPLEEGSAPLLPMPYDLVWSGFVIVNLILVIVALILLIKLQGISVPVKILMAVVVIFLPILGSIALVVAYIVYGRTSSSAARTHEPSQDSPPPS